MSNWTDYRVPTVMVTTTDGVKRPVRGLSTEDIGNLIVNHLDGMMEIATLYVQSQKDVVATGNLVELLSVASRAFPNLVSEVISIVTDEPRLIGERLPAGLQLQILQAAFRLTLEDAGGMGNLSAMFQSAIRAAVAGRGEASQRLAAILSPSSTSGAGRTPVS